MDNFLIPPGIELLAFAVALLLFLLRRRKAALVVTICSAASLYLFSIVPVRTLILAPLENSYPPLSRGPEAQAVVVLGGGTVKGSPAEAGHDAVSAEPLARLVYAMRVARERNLPIVVSGGSVLGGPGGESEAAISQRILVSLGFPAERIRTEAASLSTWENAANVAREQSGATVILVTSAYHMRRAVYSFEAHGVRVVPAPTDYLVDRPMVAATAFLPDAGVLDESARGVREWIAIGFYRLFMRSNTR